MNAIYFTLAVAAKELRLLARDRGALAVLFLLPLLISTMTAAPNVLLNTENEEAGILVAVSLVNLDDGPFGREVASAIEGISEFDLVTVETAREAERSVAEGEAAAAIVIPANFSAQIDAYTPTAIEVIVDPAQAEGAGIVAGIMNQVVAEVTIWGEVQHGIRTILDESGVLASAGREQQRALEAQNLGVIMTRLNEMRRAPAISVVTENLEGTRNADWLTRFIAYLFLGFTVIFIFFIVSTAAENLWDERDAGTLRRLLAAPLPRGAILAGKTVAFTILVCLQVVVLFTVGRAFFGMPLGRSPLALVPLTLAVALVAVALGMALAAFAKSRKQASDIGTMLGFLLGGIGGAMPLSPNPIPRAGGFIGTLARLTPHGHAVEGFYRVMAEDAGLVQILPQTGVLLAMAALFFLVAVWRLRFD